MDFAWMKCITALPHTLDCRCERGSRLPRLFRRFHGAAHRRRSAAPQKVLQLIVELQRRPPLQALPRGGVSQVIPAAESGIAVDQLQQSCGHIIMRLRTAWPQPLPRRRTLQGRSVRTLPGFQPGKQKIFFVLHSYASSAGASAFPLLSRTACRARLRGKRACASRASGPFSNCVDYTIFSL